MALIASHDSALAAEPSSGGNDAGLVFLDLETTGLSPRTSRLWEVGAIFRNGSLNTPLRHHVAGVVTDEFTPEALRISRFIERYGVDADMMDEECLTYTLATQLSRRTIIGANPAFDQAFLEDLFYRYGVTPTWNYRLVDVEALAMHRHGDLRPRSLRATADILGIEYVRADLHSAYADAELAMNIYDAVMSAVAGAESYM